MTTILGSSTPTNGATTPRPRRPLPLLAALGGLVAAAVPLALCLLVAVIGWFASDAGAHGTPRDGLRIGAAIWLVGHGSGLRVGPALVSIVPLGLTLLAAWSMWRFALRTGESVSGHGPDADGIADGERDLTVPFAAAAFGAAYLAVALITSALASTGEFGMSTGRVVLWTLALLLVVATPALAIGSGRAAIWARWVPVSVRACLTTAAGILACFLGVSALALMISLAMDFGSAANVLSRLHTDVGESSLFTLVTALLVPNAVVFSGAYLLGPGFTVGTGTLVSPALVAIGPVPAFPILAALPQNGPTPAWVLALTGVPFVVAAVAAALAHRRFPTTQWYLGALRGCVGGVLAGVAFAALAAVAGGSAGPGRMADVAPLAFDVLVHGITAFGLGGLIGGLAMTWHSRRNRPADASA